MVVPIACDDGWWTGLQIRSTFQRRRRTLALSARKVGSPDWTSGGLVWPKAEFRRTTVIGFQPGAESQREPAWRHQISSSSTTPQRTGRHSSTCASGVTSARRSTSPLAISRLVPSLRWTAPGRKSTRSAFLSVARPAGPRPTPSPPRSTPPSSSSARPATPS